MNNFDLGAQVCVGDIRDAVWFRVRDRLNPNTERIALDSLRPIYDQIDEFRRGLREIVTSEVWLASEGRLWEPVQLELSDHIDVELKRETQ